jgi:hypothetical protein
MLRGVMVSASILGLRFFWAPYNLEGNNGILEEVMIGSLQTSVAFLFDIQRTVHRDIFLL